MDSATIIVSGDLVQDWHLYAGEGASLAASAARDTVQVQETGGALLIWRLLTGDCAGNDQNGDAAGPEVILGVELPSPDLARTALAQSYLVWAPYPAMRSDEGWCWRVRDALGYGGHAQNPGKLPDLSAALRRRHILVLDDGGYVFRQERWADAWHLPVAGPASQGWIVLKHCRPVGQGHLWHRL